MGFIESEDGDGYEGEEDSELTDAEIIEAFEPGTVGQLGKNQKFVGWDPQHPSSGFKDFVKQMLRRFSATGGASYNSVAQDLESVNFSSLRDGKLTERDFWRMEQGLQIDMLNERVYEQWLPQAIMSGELGKAFPILKLDQLSVHRWQGRRWEWVDPAKEATAHKLQLANLTTTVSDIVEGEGHDLREVFETIQHERQLALEYGVDDLLPYAAAQAPPTFGAPPPNGEE